MATAGQSMEFHRSKEDSGTQSNGLKLEISNMKALPYFDVNAETTLQMDASKKELRACLIRKEKVICYASRALTKTEQNYQNLE